MIHDDSSSQRIRANLQTSAGSDYPSLWSRSTTAGDRGEKHADDEGVWLTKLTMLWTWNRSYPANLPFLPQFLQIRLPNLMPIHSQPPKKCLEMPIHLGTTRYGGQL